jgi:hypothetical protein
VYIANWAGAGAEGDIEIEGVTVGVIETPGAGVTDGVTGGVVVGVTEGVTEVPGAPEEEGVTDGVAEGETGTEFTVTLNVITLDEKPLASTEYALNTTVPIVGKL